MVEGIFFANLKFLFFIALFFSFLVFAVVKRHLFFKKSIKKLCHPDNFKNILPGFSWFRRRLKFSFLLLALTFLFLVSLRIQWGEVSGAVEQEGRHLLIAFDISRSMLAKDISPNRLEFAKTKIRELLSQLGPERVGLLVFSSDAILQCPFTKDFGSFDSFLNEIDSTSVTSGNTSISKAIKKGVSVFNRHGGVKSKIFVLFTDAEDFSSDLEQSFESAKKSNISLFTVGVGTKEGAPVPIIDGFGNEVGHEKDASGNIILTKLEAEKMSELITKFSGKFIKSTYSDQDMGQVVSFVESFEKEKFEDRKFSFKEERYPIFALFSLLFFTLEWFL